VSNEEKTNDYENFETGMIYMKILKKGGSREKGGGGNEIYVPYICIAVGDPNIKRETDGTPLTSLTTPHICVCPKPGSELSSSNVVVCAVFNDLNVIGDCC
jgi:hypothetical protein